MTAKGVSPLDIDQMDADQLEYWGRYYEGWCKKEEADYRKTED